MSAATRPYLSNEQVLELNEKHGWFQYRDAQSDVSRAFAQDAIEMHERMRAAAPELLQVAEMVLEWMPATHRVSVAARAAIAKATGSASHG